ncbi:hypothetical protein SEUCBS139899_001499 [Sporothrix eucalyptigena]|uniref:aldehyde dehydrogenase (NAD(+)) n=1 Tax=Sporothrix eucalyptigena TaxID=1812306 RepID=A0ABP0BKL3_9PEZI
MATETTTSAGAAPALLDFTRFYNIINGKLTTTAKTRHSINPSTLEANPEVPVSTEADVDRAVDAARKAYSTWRRTSYAERRAALEAYADGIAANVEGLATMLTREQGRPLALTRMEVATTAERLKETAALELPDEVIADDKDSGGQTVVKRYTPLGVACGIVPWNFPVGLAALKLSAAVLTGNTFIMKPSPFTPCANLKMVELAQQFFPPGVIQCLSGDDSLGPWLTEHPGIDKVSFTGSVATGKRIMQSCSKTLKRVTLELGGNDAAIVFPDVKDVAATAATLAQACFFNTSQICIAVKRVYVHASIYAAFRAAFVAAANGFVYGDGLLSTDPAPFMGPLTTEMQYNHVQTLLDDVRATKLAIVRGTDGRDPLATATDTAAAGKGYFVRPVVVDNPPDTARVVAEEAFGPIVPLLQWTDEEDVIRRANDTRLGLGASVWSADLAHAAEVARRLEAGNVWVNTHMMSHPSAPFGGHKWSGIGVEGGIDGLKQYCDIQVLYLAN